MGDVGAALRRRPVALATTISALLSAIYLLWQPRALDLSAQVFRADLWEKHGWVLWNDAWYSGHTLPGYGLLFPPLGALLGPELLGALCAVGAAALFAAIAQRAYGERAWLGAAWFGAASTVALFGGRITFALGLALALAAMLALQRGWTVPGAVAAALTGLASPVAGLFTALAAGAAIAAGWTSQSHRVRSQTSLTCSTAIPRTTALAVATSATVSTLALVLAFPTDGYQPFVFASWIWIPLVCLVALLLLPVEERILRWGVALYAVVGVAAFVLDTPLGGNAVRLGSTFAGPVLALALLSRRPLALALIALPLLWWQWTATVRDVAAAEGDPSTEAAYYAPLISALDAEAISGPLRVHVPPTRNRWEAVHVAEELPLARGWLRQLETDDLDEFTHSALTASGYAQWLYAHGVGYVALADAEPDYLAADEVALLEGGGLPLLREVWADEHWRLFEVRSADGTEPAPDSLLATGGAKVTELGPDEFAVRVPGPGEYLLALRYTPYFEIDEGDACLESVGGPSTRLTAAGNGPQTIAVTARLSLRGALQPEGVCSG